jgi:ubiquinone/menaquinone biosynthesis C-methylase UbiE
MADWNDVADDWTRHADENDYRNALLMPLALEILGDVRGLRLLDLGCGEGGYSRELAKRGADVVGIDGSPRLIEVAKERGPGLRYLCSKANDLPGVDADSFDVVLAAMSLMDVDDYEGAIREIARVLRPGGKLVMSITHPCFSEPLSEWRTNEAGELEHFVVDRYFDRVEWDDFISGRFRAPVTRRHKPLEDFMRPLLDRGFVLQLFREPDRAVDKSRATPRMERLRRIPYFLFMSWLKPGTV